MGNLSVTDGVMRQQIIRALAAITVDVGETLAGLCLVYFLVARSAVFTVF
jgi:hypothetical protein